MKISYFLGIDAAKHKIRIALSAAQGALLLEKDLPATALGSGGLVRGYDPLVFLMFVAGPTVVEFLLAVRRAKQLSNRERSNP